MEGATLRRPWRTWLSTIASGCAIAIALALMSLADAGNPAAQPERVFQFGTAPQVNHQGEGVATGAPATPHTGAHHVDTEPKTPTAQPSNEPRLVVAIRRDTGSATNDDAANAGGDTSTTTTTTTTTTTVPTRPPVNIGGGKGITGLGGGGGGGNRPPTTTPTHTVHHRTPKTPRKPRKPRAPRAPKQPFSPEHSQPNLILEPTVADKLKWIAAGGRLP